MTTTNRTDTDQATLWNGAGGCAWVESQDLMDALLYPFERVLVEALSSTPARAVLDVGCGTGSTTLALAEQFGPGATVTGIDISEPMLRAARARAERQGKRAEFMLGDAQTHALGAARFDLLASRFGVMFFADPIEAFRNLKRATASAGRLGLVVWRPAEENPFMTLAERVAAPLIPNLPPRTVDGPGQFAFGDRDLVHRILRSSDWKEIDISPVDVECSLPASELANYVTRFGPVGRALREVSAEVRTRFLEEAGTAFEAYVQGPAVVFSGACWLVTARA